MSTNSYRKQFQNVSEPMNYENNEYSPYSYSSLLWQIEKDQLEDILVNHKLQNSGSYLDFAAGTGRVLSFMEEYFDCATGIEISPEMIAHAEKKVKKAKIYCDDITKEGEGLSRHTRNYDLITVFRFFLNAENSLRSNVISTLATFLKNDNSILILNNHGNFFSHKILMSPWHYAKRFGKSEYQASGNYMTHSQIAQLLSESNLEIIKTYGCGFFSAKALVFIPFDILLRLERWISKSPLSLFCVNRMYVVKKIGAGQNKNA